MNTNAGHGYCHIMLAEQRRHSLTQAADHAVLFTGDDSAALPCGLQHNFLIQRLDRCQVNDPGGNALFLQRQQGLLV